MANSWGKKEAYAILNEVVKEAMGTKELSVVDATTFVSTGELLLRSQGYEKTLNSISNVYFRTIYSIRPYRGKFQIIIDEETEPWGDGERKLTPLFKELQAVSDNNTDEAIAGGSAPLENGKWVNDQIINKPELIQLNFIGMVGIEKSLTLFTEDQLNVAFRSEEEFLRFLAMMDEAWSNEIEKAYEEKRRLQVANHMAGCYINGMYYDLVEEFNREFQTEFTQTQLLHTYFENFAKFTSAFIEKKIEIFTEYTTTEHINIDGYKPIPRHTPRENQKMVFYNPYFIDVDKNIYSTLFHPEKLDIGEYEKVNFWQSLDTPTAINIKPNYMDTDGEVKDSSEAVKLDYVLGMLFDEEALKTRNVYKNTRLSAYNSRGEYQNMWYHSWFSPKSDYTEKACVFILGAGGKPSGVTLNKSTTSIVKAATETLTATTTPVGATVTWTSSNTAVATVSSGTVTGVAVGSATITASITVNHKTYTASCNVTITAE